MKGGLCNSSSATVNDEDGDDLATLELPPGFRFHPTDEEIIMHYLLKKVMDRSFTAMAIAVADLNKCEPWDLPKKAKMGDKEWWFFFERDRKYPTGTRTNRATELGYWKATGKDREVYYRDNIIVGMKKTLVFYKGRAPKGQKTNWVMHEYRLEGNLSNYNISRAAKEEFVVSRIFHRNTGITKFSQSIDSSVDHLDIPPLTYHDYYYNNHYFQGQPSSNIVTHCQDQQIITSSNHTFLQYLHYDPKNFFLPPQNTIPHTEFYPEIALPTSVFPYQPQTTSLRHHEGLGLTSIAPTIDRFSNNNSAMSHSQETGLSNENNTDEIIYLRTNGDVGSNIMSSFDQELEGVGFSPDISDYDSFWRS